MAKALVSFSLLSTQRGLLKALLVQSNEAKINKISIVIGIT